MDVKYVSNLNCIEHSINVSLFIEDSFIQYIYTLYFHFHIHLSPQLLRKKRTHHSKRCKAKQSKANVLERSPSWNHSHHQYPQGIIQSLVPNLDNSSETKFIHIRRITFNSNLKFSEFKFICVAHTKTSAVFGR